MKAVGKIIGRLIVGCIFACYLTFLNQQSFAIEGLQISVVCTNVVLSWPSLEGETYIVQYRQTLTDSNGWQTLTTSLPADSGTNFTSYIHQNAVLNSSCGCNNGASSLTTTSANRLSLASLESLAVQTVPMVIQGDGTGGAVPLAIYPPGINLSGMLILDPLTGETVSGNGYTVSALSPLSGQQSIVNESVSGAPFPGDPVPYGGNVDPVPEPETGFYRVARLGVHIMNLDSYTNVVSDAIAIPFEVANDIGTIQNIVVLVDGARYRGAVPVLPSEITGKITFDTAFLENGSHTVQVVASWLNPDGTDVNNHNISRYSDPFTLTVTNTIYYPNWEDEIGELGFAYYSFNTTCTNASWQIDIYDVSNRLAKTLSGYTTDGFVETNWDLIDVNGMTRATNDADGEFSAIITVGDPVTKAAPKQRKSLAYPSQGRWVIAFQDKFGNAVNSTIIRPLNVECQLVMKSIGLVLRGGFCN